MWEVDVSAGDLRTAQELLDAGDFDAAAAAFTRLLDDGPMFAAHVGLAVALQAQGRIPAATRSLERAYRLAADAGEAGDAASTALRLADLELTHTGAAAVAGGWLGRARHHLDGRPGDPARVLLEMLQAYASLAYDKDVDVAREHAVRARAAAREAGDAGAELLARATLGLAQVSAGDVDEGFSHLDDVTAAALAGDVTGAEALDLYCVMLTACERVRSFDRAEQWGRRVLDGARTAPGSFAAFARTQYASILVWSGRWDEADELLAQVLERPDDHPMTAAVAYVSRAQLRARQGRLDDADELLRAAEREPFRRAVRHLVIAARARLELQRGAPQVAADIAARHLRLVDPAARTERVDVRATQLAAALELGDQELAADALVELRGTARRVPTDALRAVAEVGAARCAAAAGDLATAGVALETAVDLFDAAGLPYDRTAAVVELAGVRLRAGDTDRSRGLAQEARAAAEALGARGLVDDAEEVLRTVRGPAASSAFTGRELEVLGLAADGASNAEIAATLVLSPRTVERHLSNVYLKVGVGGANARAAAIAHLRRAGLL